MSELLEDVASGLALVYSVLQNVNENGTNAPECIVELWGKDSIGNYLWEHIFESVLQTEESQGSSYGQTRIGQVTFRYRTGPAVVPPNVEQDTEYLVIVLNGRDDVKVEYSQMWLNYLATMTSIRHVALVLLGNEQCKNIWLTPYLRTHGGYIDAVFIIYDSPQVDNTTFFQWPLGVAAYRNFPKATPSPASLSTRRPFLCNFMGTVYPRSSRETLIQLITAHSLQAECFLKPRYQWQPHETEHSLSEYIQVLSFSDLTLCPAGKNTESYRIYEAMALGSIPVIEDRVVAPSECDGQGVNTHTAPLRLLKQYNAPVMYVNDWSELVGILERERSMPLADKIKRRKHIVKWYADFRRKLRDYFVTVIRDKFELR